MQHSNRGGAARRGVPRAARVLAVAAALLCAADVRAQQVVSPVQAITAARVAEARRPRPFERFSNSAQRMRDSVVTLAKAQVGRRYRLGGTTPEKGFDCSGLVRYLMAALNVELPRTAAQQSRLGRAVAADTAQLRPGDLLAFGSRKRPSHIGIYIGNGKYIHASSVAGRVIESPVQRAPARKIKPLVGVRRVLADADSNATVGGGR